MTDVHTYFRIVRELGVRGMADLLNDRLCSFNNVFILEKSLFSVAAPGAHRMQFSISEIEEADWEEILQEVHSMDIGAKREIFARALHFRNDFRHCYAIRSKTGSIAHIQWIVFPEENDVLSSRYPHFFKTLVPYEIMIENAFTFPRFRGLGLFSYATRYLLNLGREQGYKKATTYVRCEKLASLNELIRLGFSIKNVVREYRVLGVTRRRLEGPRPGRDRERAGQWNHSRGAGSEANTGPGAPVEGKGEHQHGFY